MHFIATADTDIGISKQTNQDSCLIKHAQTEDGEVMLAMICDGMGGLAKGELASATVVRAFSQWFDQELPFELENLDMQIIGAKWSLMLRKLNTQIQAYGNSFRNSMGTTVTGILLCQGEYLIAHVGDSRAYQLSRGLQQLTEDQTFVAREIRRGAMTEEEAKTDKRRNMLLQCVGASRTVEPQILQGRIEHGVYMLCSDGFRHEVSQAEIYESLNPVNLMNEAAMHSNAKYLIDLVKQRREQDNISVVLIKVD